MARSRLEPERGAPRRRDPGSRPASNSTSSLTRGRPSRGGRVSRTAICPRIGARPSRATADHRKCCRPPRTIQSWEIPGSSGSGATSAPTAERGTRSVDCSSTEAMAAPQKTRRRTGEEEAATAVATMQISWERASVRRFLSPFRDRWGIYYSRGGRSGGRVEDRDGS